MMSPEIKKAIAGLIVIFIVIVGYFGSYLPMVKSMLFISAIQSFSGVRTIQDLEKNFSMPLDFYSPIGQEELVRNTTNTIVNILQNVSDPKGIVHLVNYVESYYNPIIERGKGMSFGQNLFVLGTINEVSFIRTGDKKYLTAAENYFKKEIVLGSKRPQGLYGLLDVYKFEDNKDAFKNVADQILGQWPNDSRTKKMVDEFLKTTSQDKENKNK